MDRWDPCPDDRLLFPYFRKNRGATPVRVDPDFRRTGRAMKFESLHTPRRDRGEPAEGDLMGSNVNRDPLSNFRRQSSHWELINVSPFFRSIPVFVHLPFRPIRAALFGTDKSELGALPFRATRALPPFAAFSFSTLCQRAIPRRDRSLDGFPNQARPFPSFACFDLKLLHQGRSGTRVARISLR